MAKYFELGDARRDGLMNIGAAAQASGVSTKMIRHYESIGILPRAGRTASGYRVYRDTDVHTLRFIRRARDFGFSMREIAVLLGLWSNHRRASVDVRRLVKQHVAALDEKIAALQSMRATLQDLGDQCHGDARPECPILEELAVPAGSGPAQRRTRAGRASRRSDSLPATARSSRST